MSDNPNIIRKARDANKSRKRFNRAVEHAKKITEILAENNIENEVSVQEVVEIKRSGENKRPTSPSFPIIMLFLACIADVIDAVKAVLSLTVVVLIIFFIIEAGWAIISFIWYFKKGMSFSGLKRKAFNFIFKRFLKKRIRTFLLIFTIELVPVLDAFIPGNILMVIWAHYDHKKMFRVADEIFEIVNIYYGTQIRRLN